MVAAASNRIERELQASIDLFEIFEIWADAVHRVSYDGRLTAQQFFSALKVREVLSRLISRTSPMLAQKLNDVVSKMDLAFVDVSKDMRVPLFPCFDDAKEPLFRFMPAKNRQSDFAEVLFLLGARMEKFPDRYVCDLPISVRQMTEINWILSRSGTNTEYVNFCDLVSTWSDFVSEIERSGEFPPSELCVDEAYFYRTELEHILIKIPSEYFDCVNAIVEPIDKLFLSITTPDTGLDIEQQTMSDGFGWWEGRDVKK